MKTKNLSNLLIVTISLMLAACATQQKQINVFELEEQASKAYVDKKWKLAENKYSELISLSPGTAEIWFRLANVYAHTKKPEKAISAYREAVVRKPEYGKAWYNLGIISLQQTTAIYIEMLKHLKPNSKHYKLAKQMTEALINTLEKRRNLNGRLQSSGQIKGKE